ncbi:MAG: D-sedoheptulose 7-phosphate isomerase [Gaiellaceae bacterium]|nr:D-sedoheptulose 7-phosphate isomerase [Gaiellaceae bacterium]
MGDAFAEHLALVEQVRTLGPKIDTVARRLIEVYTGGGRLFTFGNGGSSCDAQHFAEELIARYRRERRPLAASSLSSDASVLTCIGNDFGFEHVFSRQVEGLVRDGDMVVAFSTSGRSENVVRGLAAARAQGATTVLFGGGEGRPASDHADHAFLLTSTDTARIQEMHVLLLHLIIDQVDEWAAAAS